MAQHKPGFFTASTISSLMTGKGNNLLAGGETFAKKIALERLNIINEDADFKGNICTDWGNMHEAEAISVYEIRNFVTVTDTQKCIESGWLSCTPDGCIGNDELIEVKCPFVPINHLDNLNGYGLNQYYDQVQFQLMISKRKVCNLVSYDPRFKKPYNLHAVKIIPDLNWQERCMNRIEQAEAIIKNILESLK